MASKTGSFLRSNDRQKLLRDLQQKGGLALVPESVRKEAAEASRKQNDDFCQRSSGIAEGESFGTGCLACGDDDDHANLLLCEACNAEYHTYVPPEVIWI